MMEGDVSAINLLGRLVELGRERFTGAIRFESEGVIKILYFKGGDILSASTNDRSDSVDEGGHQPYDTIRLDPAGHVPGPCCPAVMTWSARQVRPANLCHVERTRVTFGAAGRQVTPAAHSPGRQ